MFGSSLSTIRHLDTETDEQQNIRASENDIVLLLAKIAMFVVRKREYALSPRLLGSPQVSKLLIYS